MDDGFEEQIVGSGREPIHCEDCDVLTEALRDIEQQCREVENEGVRLSLESCRGMLEEVLRKENTRMARIRKLRRRRDAALDVLFMHQRLEHSNPDA